MNEIFCVIGHTGEYSDHAEWIVGWCPTKPEAEELAGLAQARAETIIKFDELAYQKVGREDSPTNEYDPNMQMDYTGTRYVVCEVPKAIWKRLEKA